MSISFNVDAPVTRPITDALDSSELRNAAIDQMALRLMENGSLKIGKFKTVTISDAFFYISDDDLFCTSIALWTLNEGAGNCAKELVRDAVSQFCEKHIDDYANYLASEAEEL